MNPFALSGLLTAIANISLGVFVFLKNRHKRLNILFAIFSVSVAAWGFGAYKIGISSEPTSALFWWYVALAGVTFIPVFFWHFVCHFLDIERKKFTILMYLIGSALLIVNFVGLLTNSTRFVFNSLHWIIPGRLFIFFTVFFFGLAIYAHYELFRALRNLSGIRREQIKYFFLATAVGYTGGGICFLPVFNIDVYPYSNFAVFIYPIIMAYAILRYRLMDIRVVVRQSTVYIISFALILLLASGLWFVLDRLFIFAPLVDVLLIVGICAGLFGSLIKYLQKLINRYFFYTLYSYEEAIKNLSGKLVTILDLDELSSTVVKELMEVMKLDRAGVLLRENETDKYQIQHIIGFREDNGISLVRDNFLTQWLNKNQRALVYEELARQIEDAKTKEIRKKLVNLQGNMKRIEAAVCLPLLSRDKIVGIIVLGNKSSGDAYSKQDIDLLQALVNQASLAIENAKLHDQIQDVNEHLQERIDEQVNEIKELYNVKEELLTIKENFLHIVSHQLRTPVSIFWGLLDNWKTGDIKDLDEKKRKRVRQQIVIAADRLQNTVNDMLDALELDRSLKLEFEPVDIMATIEEVTNTLKPNYDAKKLYLKIEKPKEKLPKVQASDKFLKQAIMNLVDNAEKYTKTGGTTISVGQLGKEDVAIEVKDTGMGLTEADKRQIMKTQFFRGSRAQDNVPNGSGLGLYIVKQIIDKHYGQIKIDSAGPDKGTTFTIILPIKQKQGKMNKKVEKI